MYFFEFFAWERTLDGELSDSFRDPHMRTAAMWISGLSWGGSESLFLLA